jgi:hypothetical protein
MDIFMAGLTECYAICDVIAQGGTGVPRLEMMGLYASGSPTMLTLKPVSFIDSISPLPIFIGVPSFVSISLA